MKIAASLILLSVFATGCASVAPVPMQTKIIDRPPLNEVRTEELGNTLLEYVISNTQPTIRVVEPWGIVSSKDKSFPPQTLRPLEVGERMNKYLADGPLGQAVCYDKTDSVFFPVSGFGTCDAIGKVFSSGPIRVEPDVYADAKAPQFRQELIYNGKVGNSVKFLYRELSGGYLRAPFTQDIQYDLQEGNEIGFKGARIEIVSSTNRTIQYKVLKAFNH